MKFRIILLLLPSFILSCQKENRGKVPAPNNSSTTQPDYRDVWIGTYVGHKLCLFWMINPPHNDTTFTGSVEMVVKKNPADNTKIIIDQDTIPIDTTGTFSGFYSPAGYHFYYVQFRNDSILLSTSMGGLGGGTNCSAEGKRK